MTNNLIPRISELGLHWQRDALPLRIYFSHYIFAFRIIFTFHAANIWARQSRLQNGGKFHTDSLRPVLRQPIHLGPGPNFKPLA